MSLASRERDDMERQKRMFSTQEATEKGLCGRNIAEAGVIR